MKPDPTTPTRPSSRAPTVAALRSALPHGVRLRRAVPGDAAAVAAFAARAFRETYAESSRPEDVEAYAAEHLTGAAFARELADPTVTLVLAEAVRGDVAGYAQLRAGGRPGDDAELDASIFPAGCPTVEVARLYVDRPWHGRGIAQALLGEAFAAAERAGGVAWLGVYEQNPRAVAFYRKSGMRVAGTQIFDMAGDRQRDWVMVWGEGRLHSPDTRRG